MVNGKFVSYLRVSTARQGASGLGLEAQREAVSRYVNGGSWALVQEVVEVESGKRSDNRPQLAKALALCRIHRATLLVAKLDRLARNVAFISTLMESSVDFVAVDLPQANKLTVHIMAAMAEYEASAISARTRAALAAARARGKKLGGLRGPAAEFAALSGKGSAAGAAVRAAKAAKRIEDLLPVMEDICAEGSASLRAIAAELNARGIGTPRPGNYKWYPVQVQRILRKIPAEALRKDPSGVPADAHAAVA
ncbi:MAG: recombinase family protein [Terracidiphilus sp.]|nr:recombinase family protein [Terracidiphilus sp.]